MPSSTTTCVEGGCDRPIKARQLCRLHYDRWVTDPANREHVRPRRSRAGGCCAHGCVAPVLAAGYCARHYARQRQHGTAEGLRKECEHCGASYAPWGRQRWCLDCAPNDDARRRLRHYGISEPEYQALLAAQQGRCALCPGPPAAVDHDHSTGRVRGLLCHYCNTRLHVLDNDPEWLAAAAAYVRR